MKVINIVIDEKLKTITLINDKQVFETEIEKAVSDSLELAFKHWHKQFLEYIEESKKK